MLQAAGAGAKTALELIGAGVKVAKEGYEVAAPVIKQGVDAVAPVVSEAVKVTTETAAPLIQKATPVVKVRQAIWWWSTIWWCSKAGVLIEGNRMGDTLGLCPSPNETLHFFWRNGAAALGIWLSHH